jgi:phage shock protein C
MKKLYRSQANKMVAGICGGIAEYFSVDATAIRLAWLLIVIFTGVFPGVIAYILALFIVPLPPQAEVKHESGQHHP